MEKILKELMTEMKKQDEKWGKQDHPSLNPSLVEHETSPDGVCMYYGVPTESLAKHYTTMAAESDKQNWAQIALEEYSEVISAVSEVDRRKELVQLTAVLLQWIQCIDRKESNTVIS